MDHHRGRHDGSHRGWRGRVGLALLRLTPIGFAIFVQMTWLVSLLLSSDRTTTARRDWQMFFTTGRRLLSGDLDSIYPHVMDSGYFWLYPPYCIYLTAPLGVVPESAAYALCAACEVGATIAAVALLRTALLPRRGQYWVAASIVFASMPFQTTVVMGQVSGILVLIAVAALWAWQREQFFSAGLLLSLLFIKPNVAALFPAVCLIGRQWKVLAGTVSGLLMLVISSLPLGLARWHDYFSTSERYVHVVRDATPMWKQLTLYAFWRTIPGLTDAQAYLLWLISASVLVLLVAATWYQLGEDRKALPRLFGLTILLTLAMNLYVYFYDGLLLMIPALVWYVRREEYRSGLYHGGVAACVALLFVVGYVRVFFVSSGVSWAGALIAAWLVLETVAVHAASRRFADSCHSPVSGQELGHHQAVG